MNENLTEEQKRDLAAMFLSKGWQLLKKELDERAKLAARRVIFGQNRATDDSDRGFIKAVDFIVAIERGLFATKTSDDEAPPTENQPSTGRYDV